MSDAIIVKKAYESHTSLLAEKIAYCILLQRFFEKILKPIKVSPNLEKPYVFCYLRVLKACFESQLLNPV
jgi:hypothetical protein